LKIWLVADADGIWTQATEEPTGTQFLTLEVQEKPDWIWIYKSNLEGAPRCITHIRELNNQMKQLEKGEVVELQMIFPVVWCTSDT
jgi:hypothetical protein